MTAPFPAEQAKHPNRRVWLLVALAIAAPALAFGLWQHFRIKPLNSLGPVTLGMKEVDVSLAYGRKPDCPGEQTPHGKRWVYNTDAPCGTVVDFVKRASGFYVNRVCSSRFRPHWIVNYAEGEEDIIRRLGQPTYVSVHEDGTSKISSFADYNVAFELSNERVIETCVTEDMPVRYEKEYRG